MVNLHKIMNTLLVGIIASNKAELEGRDVTVSDLNEAHELLKESGLIKKEEM